jgi:eukaryotic-like serine/threonine-protein kinase
MSIDPTQIQGGEERLLSREISLKRGQPPTQVPGYEPERFLGAGAYGEVWVAIERNTGRRVAIKFYSHRGGLDWSLLSREVEKLAFLFADRYVVQLLGVGWDAEPPYYIMEYLEPGSLAERLQQGPMPVDKAVELFREIAVGLVHAHGKGVLHCDLKPANILLDQDMKPRLADFGQSRLSNEQMPALGTMFYMAPEQADLEAMPDARWDVYALGALLYCMLTGHPPHRDGSTVDQFERTPDLKQRLTKYRQMIVESPQPSEHRGVSGVDSLLADIVDRCLAADPDQRFPNVQSVLDALENREIRRARRPMMVLGAIGPALLLAVVAWFAWQGFNTAIRESNTALTDRALKSSLFAAQFGARAAGKELERRYQLVEQVADSDRFRQALKQAMGKPKYKELVTKLNDPKLSAAERDTLQEEFRDDPDRKVLQRMFTRLIPSIYQPREEEEVASWFYCDAQGLSVVRVPESRTIGENFAWRSFFHGGLRDMDESWRPEQSKHLAATTLSAVFRSRATSRWVVAISTPVFDDSEEKNFLGVVAITVEVGQLIESLLRGGELQRGGEERRGAEQIFAVLVDSREGDNQGVILQHPLFDKMIETQGELPDRFQNYRIHADELPNVPERQKKYHDPIGGDPEGGRYDRHWLAQMASVKVRDSDTGWLVIVQTAYYPAIGYTMEDLTTGLLRYGLITLILIALIMTGLWAWAGSVSRKSG